MSRYISVQVSLIHTLLLLVPLTPLHAASVGKAPVIVVTPQLAADWAAQVRSYFQAESPNLNSLDGTLASLGQLDVRSRAMSKLLAPVRQETRAAARQMGVGHSGVYVPKEREEAVYEKMAVLKDGLGDFLPRWGERRWLDSQINEGMTGMSEARRATLLGKMKHIARQIAPMAADPMESEALIRTTLGDLPIRRQLVHQGKLYASTQRGVFRKDRDWTHVLQVYDVSGLLEFDGELLAVEGASLLAYDGRHWSQMFLAPNPIEKAFVRRGLLTVKTKYGTYSRTKKIWKFKRGS